MKLNYDQLCMMVHSLWFSSWQQSRITLPPVGWTGPSWGSTHMSQVYRYDLLWQTPFSGFSATPETHLLTSLFSIFFLKWHFLVQSPSPIPSAFLQNFSSKVFKINPVCWPYFWKPVWHIPTEQDLSAPPPLPRGGGELKYNVVSRHDRGFLKYTP